MSAKITSLAAQNCLRASLAEIVAEMGIPHAATQTGSNESTIRRHVKAGGWDESEIGALIAYELQEHGSSRLINALVSLRDSAQVGDGYQVERDARSAIADGAKAISEDNAALADNRINDREAWNIRARLIAAKFALERRIANIDARLRERRSAS